MDVCNRLHALEEIKAVKAHYCRFVDTKQWDAYRDLFTQDCTFDGESNGVGPIANREDFAAMARVGLANCVSIHHCHCPEIDLISDTTAKGLWAMEDRLYWDEGAGSPWRSMHGMGHYHETYTKADGVWKIASWRLTRLHVVTVPI